MVTAKTELLSQVHRHLFHAGIALAVTNNANPPPVPQTTISTLVGGSDMFGVLPAEERETFAQHFVPVTLDKGDILIQEGETAGAVYIIASGAVEVTRDEKSTHRILARIGPGEVIGLVGLLTDKPHLATGTALTDVEAHRLDRAALTTALKVCPNMARGLKELALRKEKMLLQGIAMPANGPREHAQVFLWRIREALHRLAA
jgi:CRP-like cAMP-binding protein